MIETPAAAWRIGQIAQKADFLSVGGNDLAQFYFAADRDSERVQRRYDPMNPGFLSFVKESVRRKRKRPACRFLIAASKPLDQVMAAALLGLGIEHFSIPAPAIGPFRRLMRSINVGEVEEWLNEHLSLPVESLRDEFITFLRANNVAAG